MNLYRQELLDHYKNPRNYGLISHADFTTQEHNPSCGDKVQLQATVKDLVLQQISFTGNGCILSQAAASILTEKFIGKTFTDILSIENNHLADMIQMNLGPTRLKCVVLTLEALKNGINQFLNK